jgi:hypothetical protein
MEDPHTQEILQLYVSMQRLAIRFHIN